jgi:hypothetical protein
MRELAAINVDYITVGHLLVRSLPLISSLTEANGYTTELHIRYFYILKQLMILLGLKLCLRY